MNTRVVVSIGYISPRAFRINLALSAKPRLASTPLLLLSSGNSRNYDNSRKGLPFKSHGKDYKIRFSVFQIFGTVASK